MRRMYLFIVTKNVGQILHNRPVFFSFLVSLFTVCVRKSLFCCSLTVFFFLFFFCWMIKLVRDYYCHWWWWWLWIKGNTLGFWFTFSHICAPITSCKAAVNLHCKRLWNSRLVVAKQLQSGQKNKIKSTTFNVPNSRYTYLCHFSISNVVFFRFYTDLLLLLY